jgi:signal transduction histidine kinase
VVAVLLQVVAAAATWLLTTAFPTYSFASLLDILVVALVALSWGAGPSLLATLVGVVLEEVVVVPFNAGMKQAFIGDALEVVLLLAAGITISLVASKTEGSRQRAEAGRAEAQAREISLRQVQERMDEFLATASHDLRSPGTVMTATATLVTRRFERLASAVTAQLPGLADPVEAVRRGLGDMSQSADRLARLVALLFDTSLVRAGTLELHRAPCDLAGIVSEVVHALRLAHPQRTIDLQYLSTRPIPVVADADRLGQVVTNYLTNALKYSPEDQLVAVLLSDVGAGAGAAARVAVADRGPGLPQSELDRVWQRYYRAEGIRPQSGSGHGLGLGLHICKTIVESHGGQVGVESTVGQGSTFWFTLPLANNRD